MKATEARKLAEENAPIVACAERAAKAKQAAEKKALEHTKRKKWREDFEAEVHANINYAVRNGKTECRIGIQNYSSLKSYENLFE